MKYSHKFDNNLNAYRPMKNLLNNLDTNEKLKTRVFIGLLIIAAIAVVIGHYFFGLHIVKN